MVNPITVDPVLLGVPKVRVSEARVTLLDGERGVVLWVEAHWMFLVLLARMTQVH